MELDARWGKKNTVNHHGYKNSIRTDHVATPANTPDSKCFLACSIRRTTTTIPAQIQLIHENASRDN